MMRVKYINLSGSLMTVIADCSFVYLLNEHTHTHTRATCQSVAAAFDMLSE